MKPSVFLDPLNDVGFKIMFGPKTGKDNMLNFLRAVLPNLDIRDIEYMDNEQTGFTPEERRLIFDLSVRLSDGSRATVEMQRERLRFFNYRSVLYSSHVIQAQAAHERERQTADKGCWNYHFDPVYMIGILEKGMGETVTKEDGHGNYIERYRIREITSGADLNVDLNYIYLRLDRFTKDERECSDIIDRFLYSFKNMKDLKDIPDRFRESSEMKQFYQVGSFANLPQELRHDIETHKIMTTENDRLVAAYEKMEIEIAKAEAKGKAEGKAEGRAEEKTETARSFLHLGVEIDIICKATGLTKEQVEAL